VSTVEESVEVQAPIELVYHRWTQFEEFPEFMEGVEDVEQLSSARVAWRTRIAGVERRFETEVVEQTDYQLIAWSTIEGDGPRESTVVTFDRVSADTTTVTLRMVIEDGDGDDAQVRRRVAGDLERFKARVEALG
jgi:uncharacterized membrane protein